MALYPFTLMFTTVRTCLYCYSNKKFDKITWFNPLDSGGLFHCHMLDESTCHFRGIRSILSLLFYILGKILLANTVDPDQTSHNVASDQCLQC